METKASIHDTRIAENQLIGNGTGCECRRDLYQRSDGSRYSVQVTPWVWSAERKRGVVFKDFGFHFFRSVGSSFEYQIILLVSSRAESRVFFFSWAGRLRFSNFALGSRSHGRATGRRVLGVFGREGGLAFHVEIVRPSAA